MALSACHLALTSSILPRLFIGCALMTIDFSRFYRHDELSALLHDLVRDHPDRLRIDSMGKSHEGRDIWVLTLTRFATGAAE
ncbi:MAG: hypothetical protein EBW71_09875, partial [Betaproteobacteria bacterium]|nr:hypothetical protein [Betaproteobacteria bacterium]